MRTATLIARDELRLMYRNRVALLSLGLMLLLTFTSSITSWTHQQDISELRERFQVDANEAFEHQPDRHPHRVVHYGHFVFRPLGELAAFDPGVDSFTGNAMYLEGHRQNSANFGDVRQSSLLIRFGQLTPAFVLQTLAPLLLIFLGYGAVTRERERGTLRQLLAQGVTPGALLAGKGLALTALAAMILLPSLLTFTFIASQPGSAWQLLIAIAAGYSLYLLLWATIVLLVSATTRRSRDSLLGLLTLWTLTVILLPRIAPDIAGNAQPLSSRLETDIALQNELRQTGDSHDPNDPFFAAFKQRILNQYGVERIEDLPVNYKGLLAVEGEKLTSSLFDRHARESYETQIAQSGIMDRFGLLSPAIALKRLSMAAAGTDLAGHQRFIEQAEAFRFAFVQQLNQLQADAVSYTDDIASDADAIAAQRKRVSADNWQSIPEFKFQPASSGELLRSALPAAAMLALWLVVALILLAPASRHVGRALR